MSYEEPLSVKHCWCLTSKDIDVIFYHTAYTYTHWLSNFAIYLISSFSAPVSCVYTQRSLHVSVYPYFFFHNPESWYHVWIDIEIHSGEFIVNRISSCRLYQCRLKKCKFSIKKGILYQLWVILSVSSVFCGFGARPRLSRQMLLSSERTQIMQI